MKNKIIIILVFVILALIAASFYSNKNDSGWSVYRDDTVGFEFKYPTNVPSREKLVIKELDATNSGSEKIIAWGPEGGQDTIFTVSYKKEGDIENFKGLVSRLEEFSNQKSLNIIINGQNFTKIFLVGEECANNHFITYHGNYIISIIKDSNGTCFYSGADMTTSELSSLTDEMLNSFVFTN